SLNAYPFPFFGEGCLAATFSPDFVIVTAASRAMAGVVRVSGPLPVTEAVSSESGLPACVSHHAALYLPAARPAPSTVPIFDFCFGRPCAGRSLVGLAVIDPQDRIVLTGFAEDSERGRVGREDIPLDCEPVQPRVRHFDDVRARRNLDLYRGVRRAVFVGGG